MKLRRLKLLPSFRQLKWPRRSRASWQKNPAYIFTLLLICITVLPALYVIFLHPGRIRAEVLSLTENSSTIQIDVPNRYRMIMQKGDTTDYILFYDRDEDNASPDATHEFRGPCIRESAVDYCLRDDGGRRTRVIELTETRIRIEVEGKLGNESGNTFLTESSSPNFAVTVKETYTFTVDGVFVDQYTFMQLSGVGLDSDSGQNGYEWLAVYADRTDAAYDDSGNIIYGDGHTESTTSVDGAEFDRSNHYVVMPGNGNNTYQDAIVGIMLNGWYDDNMATVQEWRWDENNTGTQDLLTAQEQNYTSGGQHYSRWFFHLRPQADLDTEAEREAYINQYRNYDTLSYTTGEGWYDNSATTGLLFNGTSSIASVGDQASLEVNDTDDLTIEGWFLKALSAQSVIVAKKTGTGSSIGYAVYYNTSNQLVFQIADGSDTYTMTSSTTLDDFTWYHFAVVWDQNSAANSTIYINGVNDSPTKTGTIGNIGNTTNSNSFTFGAFSATGSHILGVIDEIRVWSTVRSASEIQQNMMIEIPSDTANLRGYWRFNEGAGQDFYDETSNNNHGTLGASGAVNSDDPVWKSGFIPNNFNDGQASYTLNASSDEASFDIDSEVNVSTLLNGSVSKGATTITVDSTAGFASSGVAYIEGDKFTYSGTTATTFTGIPSSGDDAVSGHADNSIVATSSRSNPLFKMSKFRKDVDNFSITLEGNTLTSGTDYNANIKPFSSAGFQDEITWYSSLESEAAAENPDIGTGGSSGSNNVAYIGGKYGKGAYFNGTSAFHYFPTSGNVDLTGDSAGMIEFWMRPDWASTTTSTSRWITGSINAGNFDAFLLTYCGADINCASAGLGTAGDLMFGTLDGAVWQTKLTVSNANYNWNAGDWIHVRMVWDDTLGSGDLRLFLNGVEPTHSHINEGNLDISALALNNDWFLGRADASVTTSYFLGMIDEFTIYSLNSSSTTLAQGGNTDDSSEYLNDTSSNFSLGFNPVDAAGRGEYLYVGSDSKFYGVNVDLATNGASGGSLNLDWEYWNGNSWQSLESITGFTDNTNNFTQDGAVYWDQIPTSWRPYSINGDSDNYVIRVSLNNGSGSYSTDPIENRIRTDVLLFQYLGTLSSQDQTFTITEFIATNTPTNSPTSTPSPTPSPSPTPVPSRASQPKLYWSLNDGHATTINDSSGNAKAGTLTGALWQTEDLCIFGKCLFFDGGGDFVTRADDDDLDIAAAGSISLSAWVRTAPVSADQVIIAKHETTGGDGGYKLLMDSNGNFSCGIDTNNSGFPLDVAASTTNNYDDNRWHHVVCVKDGSSSLNLYVDGVLIATDGSITSSSIANNDPLYIGIDGNGSSNPWRGFIDEVKIYDHALIGASVRAEFITRGSPGFASTQIGGTSAASFLSDGLLGYWKLDEQAPNTCTGGSNDACDSSGNGIDGAWNGNTADTTDAKFDHGITVDGAGDYIDLGTSINLANSSFSVAGWVKRDVAGSGDTLFAVGTGSTNNALHLTFTSSDELRCGFFNNDLTSTESYTSTDTWHHIACTYDVESNTRMIFYDGEMVASDNPSSPFVGTGTAYINRDSWTNAGYIDGRIDEVRVYNRPLSPVQIKSLYNWAPTPDFYLNFDENSGNSAVNDYSGNDRTVSMSNFPANPWTMGKYGSSLSFDGSNDQLSATNLFGDLTTPGYQNWSMTTWVKTNSAKASGNYVILGSVNGEGTVFLNIDISSGAISAHADLCGGSNCSSSSATVPEDTWTHVGWVRDADNIYFYINGVLAETISAPGSNMLSDNTDGQIGRFSNSSSDIFQGELDDLKIYTYTRSADQIIEDMNGTHPLGGSPIGSQVARWKLDEGFGSVINNYVSTHTFTETLSGPTWRTANDCKYDSCLEFDGTNDTLTVTNTNTIDFDVGLSNGFSFSTWFYADSDGQNNVGRIFQKGSNTYCRTDSQSGSSLDVECNVDLATTDANLNISSAVTTGTWNHLLLTYDDAATIRVYINGIYRGSDTGAGATAADSSNLVIGGGGTAHFDGKIDDFKVYSAALTQQEVLIDFNANSSSSFSVGSLEANNLTDGAGNPPISYWPLDETSGTRFDHGSNGNNLTDNNTVLSQIGKINKAADFERSNNESLSIADGSQTGLDGDGTISISAWFNLESCGCDDNDRYTIVKKNSGSSVPSYTLRFTDALGDPYLQGYTSDNGTSESSQVTYTTPISTGVWYHVTWVLDGTNSILYINGQQVASTSYSGTPYNGNGTFTLGDSWNMYFDGLIDEVKFYDYPRTAAQVAYEFNRGRPVAHYKFDECTGTTAHNAALNANGQAAGNNGTISIGGGGSNSSAGTCNSGDTTQAWNNGSAGKFNSSLDLDGTDDRVSVTSLPSFDDLSSFTSAGWFRWETSGSQQVILQKSTHAHLYISSSNIFSSFFGGSQCSSGQSIAQNRWYHGAMTYDGSNVRLYLNGQLVATCARSANTGTGALSIGSDNTPTQYFNGQIDDIQLFNYPLSATQTRILMNQSSTRFGQ